MAEIVPLRPSEHDAVQQLLPWHVNGTLAAEETARVEAHLAECEECRHDLSRERELAREVALLPLDVDEGWQAMTMRLPDQISKRPGGRLPLSAGRSAARWRRRSRSRWRLSGCNSPWRPRRRSMHSGPPALPHPAR